MEYLELDAAKNGNHKTETDPQQLEHEKELIYQHPFFPILALLLKKCETATNDLGQLEGSQVGEQQLRQELACLVESIDQSELGRNPELDHLMLSGIQVLGINLSELIKVSELCNDFCQKYISCLRVKLSSDNLLSPWDEDAPIEEDEDGVQTSSSNESKRSKSNHETYSSESSQYCSDDSSQSVQQTNPTEVLDGEEDMFLDLTVQNKKKGVLPKQATSIMKSWLFQHIVHPYPTEDEKAAIGQQTGLTLLQINNWFINARRRILQPMLESTSETASKKSTPQNPNNATQGSHRSAQKISSSSSSSSSSS